MLDLNEEAMVLVNEKGQILEGWYDGLPVMADYECDLRHLEGLLSVKRQEQGGYRMARVKLIEITEDKQ